MSKLLANQIANYGDDAPIEIKEGLNIPAGKPIQAAGSAGTSGQVLSSTGTTIQWVTPFDGDYNTLTNKPTIPAAQVNADWNATGGVSLILNKPVVPLPPSVTTAAAGTAALSYNSTNGEFTFTPPDLSGYATETWVNGRGYLTSYTETDTLDSVTGRGATTTNALTVGGVSIGDDDGSRTKSLTLGDDDDLTLYYDGSVGYVTSYIESDQMIIRPKTTPSDTYIDMIEGGPVRLYHGSNTRLSTSATGVGISGDLDVTGKIFYSNNFADLTALNAVNAGTYHGMFAHVHAEGHGYFAHAGAWTQLLDTGSSISELADVNLAVAPQSGQVLAYDGSNWVATAAGGGGGGIALTDLSVTTNAAGSAALTYNNVSGVFTYTPPDVSGFLTTETDPVFQASAAAGITSTNITNWNLAYGWGNHAGAGYLTAEADTLQTVTTRGATTSNAIQVGRLNIGSTNQSILIPSGTNDVTFQNTATGGEIFLQANSTITVNNYAQFLNGGDIILNDSQFGTTYFSNGATVTGTLVVTNGITLSSGNLSLTSGNATIAGSLTAGGLTYPTTNGTSGQVLTSDGAGNVTWQDSTGGSGGANVTISDTIPAGTPAAGDLWWESDTGRLKVYYTDTDSSQWVDTSPPLSVDNINDVVTANGFKFRLNESTPPAGTLGELRQIDSRPHFYDGTNWQEFILASTEVATIPAETAWDNVIIRTTFDNDVDDIRFGQTGDLDHFTGVVNSTRVASPVKFGTNALKSVGDGVQYANRAEYDFTGEFTIECWIYFDSANISASVNGGEQVIISKQNSTQSSGWALYTRIDQYGNRSWSFRYYDTSIASNVSVLLENIAGVSWSSIYPNTWVHIALTKDSNGALHFYRDGTESSTTNPGVSFANGISNTTDSIMFGGGKVSSINAFDGFIDDIRVTTDVRYTSNFTPPATAHPISGATTTYTPPATSKAGEITLGATPSWNGTLGVSVSQQSSGNYRLTFANAFTNATDYYVFAHHMDYGGGQFVYVKTNRSAGYIDFVVYREGDGANVDTGSVSVQVIAH